MTSRLTRIGSCVVLFLFCGGIVASAGPAVGARRVRCEGAPFSFAAVRTTDFVRARHRARVGWEASGATELGCPGGVLSIDVWEHAAVGAGADAGGARVVGDVTLRVSIPDGGTVVLGGLMQAGGPCVAGVCTVAGEVRARGRGGEMLRIEQVTTIDFATGEVEQVDVARIVIEFTGAG